MTGIDICADSAAKVGRGGAGDFFPLYSAAGRRNGTARVYSFALPFAPYTEDAAPKVRWQTLVC